MNVYEFKAPLSDDLKEQINALLLDEKLTKKKILNHAYVIYDLGMPTMLAWFSYVNSFKFSDDGAKQIIHTIWCNFPKHIVREFCNWVNGLNERSPKFQQSSPFGISQRYR